MSALPSTWAFLGAPHPGGTFTVFRLLRQGLRPHGIDVRWIGSGRRHLALANSSFAADYSDCGEILAGTSDDDRERSLALVSHLSSGGYEGVFLGALTHQSEMSVARHLPESLLRILLVHSISRATYEAAAWMRAYVHATVGVGPRVTNTLQRSFRFDSSSIRTIMHGIDAAGFSAPRTHPRSPKSLRLLYLGRIEDTSKGVFFLPQILEQLRTVQPETITIAGDGPDLESLRSRLAPFPGVRFLGFVSPDRLPELVARHDVALMPSRFEGFGLTLIECMAGGCVPVASRISGITDQVVEHGREGFLFPIGETRAAAEYVDQLGTITGQLESMSEAARQAVHARFTVERMASDYASLIAEIRTSPPQVPPPRPADTWSPMRLPTASLRALVPRWIKNLMRRWL